jgi:hypothetical protein
MKSIQRQPIPGSLPVDKIQLPGQLIEQEETEVTEWQLRYVRLLCGHTLDRKTANDSGGVAERGITEERN